MSEKIAFVASEYSENEFSSGGVKLNCELITELKKRGYSIDVFAQKYFVKNNLADNYFDFDELKNINLKESYKFSISEKAVYPTDITYIHDHSYKYRISKMKSRLGKVLYKIFSQKSHQKRLKQDEIIKNNLDKISKIVVSSEVLKNDMIENFNQDKNKIFILPPSITQDGSAKFTERHKPFIFGLSAVGFERKGGFEVLKAVNTLKEINDNFIVKIIYPKAKSNFGVQFNLFANNIEKYIEFLPLQKDMNEFYNSIDCLLMPSLIEPFGMVATEAMSHYKPVIATDCCGACDLINNEDFICTKKNLYKSMQNIMEINSLEYERIANDFYNKVKNMNWNSFCDIFINILTDNK